MLFRSSRNPTIISWKTVLMGSLLTSTSMSPHKCTRDIPCCRPGCNPGSRPCSLGTAAPDNLSLCPLCASLCPKYPPLARLPRLAPASRFVPASGLVMSGAVFQCPFVPLPGSFFSRPVRHPPRCPAGRTQIYRTACSVWWCSQVCSS